jgi:hypothetical protein
MACGFILVNDLATKPSPRGQTVEYRQLFELFCPRAGVTLVCRKTRIGTADGIAGLSFFPHKTDAGKQLKWVLRQEFGKRGLKWVQS